MHDFVQDLNMKLRTTENKQLNPMRTQTFWPTSGRKSGEKYWSMTLLLNQFMLYFLELSNHISLGVSQIVRIIRGETKMVQ